MSASDQEVIDTQRMPDGTEYRVSIAPDTSATEGPHDDGQWPILRWTYRFGFSVEAYNDQAKPYVAKFKTIWDRHGWEVFERYVRIFHGVSQVREYGPNNGTDYTYIAFDPRAWREEIGTDAAHLAEEKPLAEIEAWIEGDVYGVLTEKRWNPDEDQEDDEGWEGLESVWGYYGRKYAEESAKDQLEVLVNSHRIVHRYPEAEKLAKVSGEVSAIMGFLETHTLQGHTAVQGGQQQMVFEHFGIDTKALEVERRLMLQRLSEDQDDKPTPQ